MSGDYQKYPADDAGAVRAAEFWEQRYKSRDAGWDLGEATPPMVEFFSSERGPKPPARVLVPGCGRGHDALFLAKLGFNVVAVDFAKQALDSLRRRRRNLWIPPEKCKTARFDILHLPDRYHASFDIIFEHTCFCAIDPSLRNHYAEMAAQVLVPGGLLVGLFYPFRDAAPGPPFPVTEIEMNIRFSVAFDLLSIETPASSVERRRGEERLIVMRRKGEPVVAPPPAAGE